MKKIILLTLAAAFAVGCSVDDKYYGEDPEEFKPPYKIDWYAAADSSTQMVLIDHHYMNGLNNRWHFNDMSDKSSNANNTYWPQAHAIDVVTDAYIRSGNDYYKDIIERWYAFVPTWQYGKDTPRSDLNSDKYYGQYGYTNGPANNGWWNQYIDDMEWIVLAHIRMHYALSDDPTVESRYMSTAKLIYDSWIRTTWDLDGGGGILWSFDDDQDKSKNACSNGPAAIIAARLYRFYQDDYLLDDAKKIYHWLKTVLYDDELGRVWDNFNCVTQRRNGDFFWTYNTGTFLGAAHELYDLTGQDSYLMEAVKAADYTITVETDATGKQLLLNWFGDGYLFNGIFVRYFTLLTNDTRVDKATRKKFHDFLTEMATILWTQGVIKDDPDGYGMLYSPNFYNAGYFVQSLNVNVTGCVVIEAMNILKPLE